ncbi:MULTISPECIES: septum site-determining protein MinC [Roseovarius]|nr:MULTISPECIES: septum site-determining protein MinC [Roseovarius]MDM8164466.1 septum site-determining protein MinC [Roseovarius sp.]
MSTRDDETRHGGMPGEIIPFQIRGRFLMALSLRVDVEADDAAFYERLDAQRETSPQFFDEAPMVIDLGNVPGMAEPERLRAMVAKLRERNLRVFGVQNPGALSEEALQEMGLIPVLAGKDAPLPDARSTKRRRRAALRGVENKLVKAPVRSGQMVVCESGDLTVIGSVASGSEVVAGGNIHIYGRLRGRAMAGVHGDESARIFCRSLDAELLAIAGLYKTSETLEDAVRDRATHIYLENERLCMEVIG